MEREERLKAALADRYQIEREIGSGGMATVYLARDLKHERKVAVKVLNPDLARTLGSERFLREIQIAAKLNHPHILTLIDSGEADGLLFYVMPFVVGESLRDRLQRQSQLPIEEALRIASEVADGLQYAHSLGIIHRDVKPENVLLLGKHAVLADFGIARALFAAGGELTQTSGSVGSPGYMSPEQAAGSDHLDGRSDLYGLACVLYEMLAGEPPFSGTNLQALIAKHVLEPVPDVRVLRDATPKHISAAIQKAMAKSPADRFASVEEFEGLLTRPFPRNANPPGGFPKGPHKVVLGLAAALLVLVAGVTSMGLRDGGWLQGVRRGSTDGSQVVGRQDSRSQTHSIAVLPFLDLSESGDREYFSEGVSEEVLNLLASIPDLRVTSRTSAFSFKGQDVDVRTIAQRLGVSHVLEGSVRTVGDSARISVRLVDAEEDIRVWSDTFRGALADIFAIQDQIAAQVTNALMKTLISGTPRSLRTEPEAYRLYLQGRHVAHQVTAENLTRAIGLFEECLALDPQYVPAWDALASAYINQSNTGQVPSRQGYAKAREAAEKALELDPEFARSHGRLGWVAMFSDGNLAAAARHYQRAIELDPNDVFLLNGAAILANGLGRTADAIRILQHVTTRDPIFPAGHANLGIRRLYAGELDDAISSFRTALSLAPNYIGAQYLIGMALLQKGDLEDALVAVEEEPFEPFRLIGLALVHHALGNEAESDAVLDQLIEEHSSGWAYNIAYVYAYRGQVDAAFDWLDLAVDYQDSGLGDVAVQPLFANLFGDPRWQKFLERLGRSKDQLNTIDFRVSLPD